VKPSVINSSSSNGDLARFENIIEVKPLILLGPNTKIRGSLSGASFMGEEKPDEELMGKRKSSPRLSTASLNADNYRIARKGKFIHLFLINMKCCIDKRCIQRYYSGRNRVRMLIVASSLLGGDSK